MNRYKVIAWFNQTRLSISNPFDTYGQAVAYVSALAYEGLFVAELNVIRGELAVFDGHDPDGILFVQGRIEVSA